MMCRSTCLGKLLNRSAASIRRWPAIIQLDMAAKLLSCDELGCSEPAVAFSLGPRAIKLKVCRGHAHILAEKQLPVLDISVFTFIQSVEDASLYQERREFVHKSLGNLSNLETRCESDWKAMQARLDFAKSSVLALTERCFQEVLLQGWQRYEAAKQTLSQVRTNLERLLTDKEFRLSPKDKAICKTNSAVSWFQVVVGDFRPALAEIVKAHCCLLPSQEGLTLDETAAQVAAFSKKQAEEGRADMAEEARYYAKALNPADVTPSFQSAALSLQAKSAKRVLLLLPDTAVEEEVREVADKYLKFAIEFKDLGNYEKARKKLKHAETLLAQWNLESSNISLEYGLILAHFALRSDAEAVLKHGLEVETATSPTSDLAMRLNNSIAELHYQAGHWQEAVVASERTLQTWSTSENAYELYIALFILASGQNMLGNRKAAQEQVREWTGKLVADTAKSKCVLLYVLADKLRKKARREEKAMVFEQGLELGQQVLSDSYLTACARHRLGITYKALQKFEPAEDQFLTAVQIFSSHYPQSLEFANCLHSLGSLYKSTKRVDLAEKQWQSACQIYAAHFPLTLDYTISLHSLGLLYKAMKRAEQAEEQYLKACEIYEVTYPESLDYANCLNNLGFLYCDLMRQMEQAEKVWLRAIQIYMSYFPQSLDYATCLKNLAFLYESKGRKSEAVQRVEQAMKLYVESGNKSKVVECEQVLRRLKSERTSIITS